MHGGGRGGEDGEEGEWAGATEAAQALREAVLWSLEKGLAGNGTWLAERLWAMSRTQGALGLLATCHLRAGRAGRAYALLRPHLHPLARDPAGAAPPPPGFLSAPNRFLFAQVCFHLGRLKEAHDALLPYSAAAPPLDAAGFYLLGQIMRYRHAPHPRACKRSRLGAAAAAAVVGASECPGIIGGRGGAGSPANALFIRGRCVWRAVVMSGIRTRKGGRSST
jgi:hypothetical protein